MIRNKVVDCVLALAGGRELPVAGFDVRFRLNEIPTAIITPALGREIRTDKTEGLAAAARGADAALWLEMEGMAGNGAALSGRRLLLNGFIQSVGMTDTSTPAARWLNGEIGVLHRAGKLAGSPAVSYTFAGSHAGTSLTQATGRLWNNSPLRSEGGVNSALFPLNRLLLDIFGSANIGTGALFPTTLLRAMIISLVAGSEIAGGAAGAAGPEGVFTRAQIEALVKDYPAANLTPYMDWLGSGYFVARAMLERYETGWQEHNLWQAVLAVCQYMQLSIVPFNNGFYIANPFGLIQEPDLVLDSGDYVSLRQSTTMRSRSPMNGVVVSIPPLQIKQQTGDNTANTDTSWNFFYPPLRATNGTAIYKAKGETGAKLGAGMYYHWCSLPSWLYPVATRQFGELRTDAKRKSVVQRPKATQDLAEWADTMGVRAAKMLYAEMLMEQAAISLVLPYREDIMPGTVLRIQTGSADAAAAGFIGDTLYGMVNNVRLYCSTTDSSPHLNLEVQLTHVRGTADNQEPPSGIALAAVPLHENRWVGTDLFGTLLKKMPESAKPPRT